MAALSAGAERAGPEELLSLVRNHWHIENRLLFPEFSRGIPPRIDRSVPWTDWVG